MAPESEQKTTPPKGFEQGSFGGSGSLYPREESKRRGYCRKHNLAAHRRGLEVFA